MMLIRCGDIIPGKSTTFIAPVEADSPPPKFAKLRANFGGGAGFCPRVQAAYSEAPFIAIVLRRLLI